MSAAGIARINTCFDDMIVFFPAGDSQNREEDGPDAQSRFLPQMPHAPLQLVPARRVLADRESAFEERVAIIGYDGGMARPLAELLAGR